MNYLLLGGAPSVGKSESIYRATAILIARGFTITVGNYPATFSDFLIILEGRDRLGNQVRILVNSASDTIDIINALKTFYDNNPPIDLVFSSIRDHNFWPRMDFISAMNISPSDTVIEIPLAKITRRTNFTLALAWYQGAIGNLVSRVLSSPPFNV